MDEIDPAHSTLLSQKIFHPWLYSLRVGDDALRPVAERATMITAAYIPEESTTTDTKEENQLSFTGRDDEMEALAKWQSLAAKEDGNGALLISGASGIGKTRLCEEFLKIQKQARVVKLSAEETHGTPVPGQLLTLFLNQLLPDRADTPTEQIISERIDVLFGDSSEEERRDALHLMMFSLGKSLPHAKTSSNTARLLSAKQTKQRNLEIFKLWGKYLERELEQSPLLIFVDDLQNIDRTSLDFLLDLTRKLRGKGLYFLGAASPDLNQKYSWPKDCGTLTLSSLGDSHLRDILIQRVPDIFTYAGQIIKDAAGDIRSLEDIIILIQHFGGKIVDGQIYDQYDRPWIGSASLYHVINTSSQDRVLQTASFIGTSFSRDELRDLGVKFIDESLDEWVRYGILTRQRGRYGFRSPGLKTFLMDHNDMTSNQHLQRANILRETRSTDKARMAFHFSKGGNPDQAVHYYLEAAEEAHQLGDDDIAIKYFSEALSHPMPTTTRFKAFRGMDEAYLSSRRYAEQFDIYRRTQNLFSKMGHSISNTDLQGTRMRHARGLMRNNQTQEALAICAEIFSNLRFKSKESVDHDETKVLIATLLVAGTCHRKRAQLKEALSYYEEALKLAKLVDDKLLQADALLGIAWHASTQGDYAKALACNKKALALHQEAGEIRYIFSGYTAVASNLNSLGHYEKAEKKIEEALEDARRLGQSGDTLDSLEVTKGQVLINLKKYREAASHLDSYRRQYPKHRSIGYNLLFLAYAHYLDNNHQEAIQVATELLTHGTNTNDTSMTASAKSILSILKLSDNTTEAMELSASSIALLDKIGGIEDFDIILISLRVELLLKTKNIDDAKKLNSRLVSTIKERAHPLTDENDRNTYRTIDLHQQAMNRFAANQ